MVYDWGGYREVCFQMYITEKKSLEEIMDYMKEVHRFAPSKRAFQTQFKRWGFPSKQNPAHKNAQLVARIKELWEKNTSQRDMLHILNSEGFEIKERELMRVRAKNRWLLRVPNGMKAHGYTEALIDQPQSTDDADPMALPQEIYAPEAADITASGQVQVSRPVSPPLAPEVIAKRKERFDRLKAESESRYAARKRRRRTRGWAGLPADPPAPPRFPSETTIDESKTYLSLDNARYRELREKFQKICEDVGIIKKTLAGDDQWRDAKDRLIQESPHLTQVFYVDNTQREAKQLALDVICTDVTKRMRTLERRMTIAEAKNSLGINPEESRRIRNAFYNTLKEDHFTSKLEAGEEHWKELKDKWIQDSPLLQSILNQGDADTEHQNKLKAMEVLCRDVMKRLRDDQTRRDPSRKTALTESPQQASASPAAMAPPVTRPARPAPTPRVKAPAAPAQQSHNSSDISTLASKALARTPILDSTITDMQIDPSLLQAANDPTFASAMEGLTSSSDIGYLPDTTTDLTTFPSPQQPQPAIPVYIRPHPQSQIRRSAQKMFLAKLLTRSVSELRGHISAKHPNLNIRRIDGVEKQAGGTTGAADGVSGEVSYLIDGDEELDAYLTHVDGGKAMFVVMLG